LLSLFRGLGLGEKPLDSLHGFLSLRTSSHVAKPRRIIKEALQRRPRQIFRSNHRFVSFSRYRIRGFWMVRPRLSRTATSGANIGAPDSLSQDLPLQAKIVTPFQGP
jgi:hypothetical protein